MLEWRRRFYRDDRVRAARDRCTSRNPERLASTDRARRRLPGRHVAGHRQSDGALLGRTNGVGGPDRVAVHRGVVPRWQRDPRDDRLRKDAPERLGSCDGLGFHRFPDRSEDARTGFLDGQQSVGDSGHMVSGAGLAELPVAAARCAARSRSPAIHHNTTDSTTISTPTAIAVSCQNTNGKSWTSRSVLGSNV